MLCDNGVDEDYRGLDSDRDTEEEIETAIRFFPDVLSRQKKFVWDIDDEDEDQDGDFYYPIQLLALTRRDGTSKAWCNEKAVYFIPLLARLAIELCLLFDDEAERGGLLFHAGYKIMFCKISCVVKKNKTHNREHHEAVDD
jgi:hypothetical protein